MRRGEIFHGLYAPDDAWLVIRVDGRAFDGYTSRYDKPFDPKFHHHMVAVAQALTAEFHGRLAYTQSDECSVVLDPGFNLFGRSVEKLISIAASTATAAFVLSSGDAVTFDARICAYAASSTIVDYLTWRQEDCWRCCVNGWAYWTARNEGSSPAEATKQANGDSQHKHDFLMARDINVARVPGWQRGGVLVARETYLKEGLNPQTQEATQTTRSRLGVQTELPYGEEYRELCRELLL
jgi:tRNA(His) 5'-end guanylyltransferase